MPAIEDMPAIPGIPAMPDIPDIPGIPEPLALVPPPIAPAAATAIRAPHASTTATRTSNVRLRSSPRGAA